MKAHIEKVFVIAGNAHRYQYLITAISVLIWGFTTFFSCSLAFLEAQPNVILYPGTPQSQTVVLTYDLCGITDKIILQDELHYSWTNELGIQCEQLMTSLIGTVTSFGYLLGAAMSSTVNYFLGERKALLGSLLLFNLTLITSIFIKNYYYYCFTTFTCCFCSNISAYTGMVLLNEIIDQKKKAIFSIFIYSGMGVGGITYFGLFYVMSNWRQVFWFTIGVVCLIEALIALILIDSPLKAINSNDFVTFISLMRFVAKVNGKLETFDLEVGTESYLNSFIRLFGAENKNEISTIIESFVGTQVLQHALNDSMVVNENREFLQKKQRTMASTQKESIKTMKKENVVLCLFKYKSVRTPFLMFCFFWFSNSCLFSGLAINLKFLAGDITVNGILLYSVEIAGYIACGFLINTRRFGRKGSMMLFSGGIAVSLALYAFFLNHSILSRTFYIIARFFVMAAYSLFYTYALESYPNSIKTTAYALNGSCNSFGGMVVPFFVEYIKSFYLFIGFAVLISVNTGLMFFLRETLGKVPSDEIIEIETHYAEGRENALKHNLSDINEITIE